MNLLLKPSPHKDAAAWLAAKPILARQAFDNLVPDLKARAFTITGVESANVMQAVRDRIAELPQGADWDTLKQDVAARISPWLDQPETQNSESGTVGDVSAAERRAELLLRNHGFQAYAVANEEVMQRQKDAFPYAQYLGVDDDHERDAHRALNDIVLPVDDPFWETHTGPWDWGCRCQKVPLTRADMADMREADQGKAPEAQRVVTGPRLQALREGRLIVAGPGGMPQFVNVAPSSTYTFNPRTIRMDATDLRGRYDAETWGRFEEWARQVEFADGRNVFDWLGGKAPAVAPSPATPPPAVDPNPEPKTQNPEPPPAAPVPAPEPFKLAANTVADERTAIRTADYKTTDHLGGGVNATYKLTNGRTVVFKPGEGEDKRQLRRGVKSGTQYKREIAASLLDEELGLNLVPPTTLLVRNGIEGSAQLFKTGFKPAGRYSPREMFEAFKKIPDRVKQDWQLFEDLSAHLDRHMMNLMLRVKGAEVEVALIDNGLSFSTIRQGKAYPGPLERKPIDDTNLSRLRNLLARRDDVTAALQPYLEPAAIDLLFERAQILLTRKTYGDTHTP